LNFIERCVETLRAIGHRFALS